jgi:hypothetical protein
MTLKKCNDCKTEYQDQDAQRFGHCPNCDSTFFSLVSLREVASTTTENSKGKDFQSTASKTSSSSGSPKSIGNFVGPKNEQHGQFADIERLIAAQNKTTHAIRAFVRFFFIQLTGLTAAAFVWYVSLFFVDQQQCFDYGDNCNGNLLLQVIAIGIWVGTVIYSSAEGWSELEKSKV